MQDDTPIRQCIACRKKGRKRDLVRISQTPSGRIVFDPKQTVQGRGVYVCSDRQCIEKASANGLFDQALKGCVPGSVLTQLAKEVVTSEKTTLDTLIGFAARAYKITAGITLIERTACKGNLRVIVMDRETGDTTRNRIEALSSSHHIPLIIKSTGRLIQDIIGKPNCRCVGIVDSEFARSIRNVSASS